MWLPISATLLLAQGALCYDAFFYYLGGCGGNRVGFFFNGGCRHLNNGYAQSIYWYYTDR
jgi:hypothetical protein